MPVSLLRELLDPRGIILGAAVEDSASLFGRMADVLVVESVIPIHSRFTVAKDVVVISLFLLCLAIARILVFGVGFDSSFSLAGAGLDLPTLVLAWPMALLLVAVRRFPTWIFAWMACRYSKCSETLTHFPFRAYTGGRISY